MEAIEPSMEACLKLPPLKGAVCLSAQNAKEGRSTTGENQIITGIITGLVIPREPPPHPFTLH